MFRLFIVHTWVWINYIRPRQISAKDELNLGKKTTNLLLCSHWRSSIQENGKNDVVFIHAFRESRLIRHTRKTKTTNRNDSADLRLHWWSYPILSLIWGPTQSETEKKDEIFRRRISGGRVKSKYNHFIFFANVMPSPQFFVFCTQTYANISMIFI